jgi:hypothetical protein
MKITIVTAPNDMLSIQAEGEQEDDGKEVLKVLLKAALGLVGNAPVEKSLIAKPTAGVFADKLNGGITS